MIYKNGEGMCDFFGLFIFIVVLVFYILGALLIKQLFHLVLVGYEMIIANSVLRASLASCHLISNVCSWNNLLLIILPVKL